MTAPSLPRWPTLLFDPEKGEAIVEARFANWKSYKHGHLATKWIHAINCLGSPFVLWQVLPKFGNPVQRVVWVYVAYIAWMWISYRLLNQVLPGVLARQFFATKVRLWFNQHAVAFKSELYRDAVIVRRVFSGMPVRISCTLEEDVAAAHHLDAIRHEKSANQAHASGSGCFAILISQINESGTLTSGDHQVAKTIHVCSIPKTWVPNLAAVCNAANHLTSNVDLTSPNQQDANDIDLQ